VSVTPVIWFPRSVTASAEQFGTMGVAFALLSWLFAAACVLDDAHRMRNAGRA
jgi:hypothetical protein